MIPLSDQFVEHATEVAKALISQGIRADVDDRSESMGKKIRNAEREWIPYILVIGEREASAGKVSVRKRGSKEQEIQDPVHVGDEILAVVGAMPKRPLPLPMMLSKRPIFVGGK